MRHEPVIYRAVIDQGGSEWFLDSLCRDGHPLDQRVFTVCQSYSDPGELTLGVTHAGEPVDFFLGTFGLPIVSEKIAIALAPLIGGDAQLVPVRVEGVEARRYILNVTRCLSCIDETESEFDRWKQSDGIPRLVGSYRFMYKLWLDYVRVGDCHAFRVAEWKVALCVSGSVRSALSRVGHTGIAFVRVG